MDYVKSVTQEKMQVWMNIMIKYFTLPVSTASSPDAETNWNGYAPIQDIFHKNPHKYCIIPGCRNELELLCTDTGYLPQESHIPEEIGFSESFYTGTKAPLQISMATEHDSMLFQPEDDSGCSCGPFTIVKVLETLLQLERNGMAKPNFLANRHISVWRLSPGKL